MKKNIHYFIKMGLFYTGEHKCSDCDHKKDPNYVMGSSFLTLIIGSLVFLTALAWNEVAEIKFKPDKHQNRNLDVAVFYAAILTFSAILVIFLSMYFIPGTTW